MDIFLTIHEVQFMTLLKTPPGPDVPLQAAIEAPAAAHALAYRSHARDAEEFLRTRPVSSTSRCDGFWSVFVRCQVQRRRDGRLGRSQHRLDVWQTPCCPTEW